MMETCVSFANYLISWLVEADCDLVTCALNEVARLVLVQKPNWCKAWRQSPQYICYICIWASGKFTHTTFSQICVLLNPPKFTDSLSQLPHSHPAAVGDFPVGRRVQSGQLFTHESVKIFSRVESWQEMGPTTKTGKRWRSQFSFYQMSLNQNGNYTFVGEHLLATSSSLQHYTHGKSLLFTCPSLTSLKLMQNTCAFVGKKSHKCWWKQR